MSKHLLVLFFCLFLVMIEPKNTPDVPMPPHAVAAVTVKFVPESSKDHGVA